VKLTKEKVAKRKIHMMIIIISYKYSLLQI